MSERAPLQVPTTSRCAFAAGEPSEARLWALVVAGAELSTVPLPRRGHVSIGRAAGCDLLIDHASVSRHHAVLHIGDSLMIQDLGSTNGTRVGGVRLLDGRPVALAFDQIVDIGTTTLVLQSRAEPPRERRFGDHARFVQRARAEIASARERNGALLIACLEWDRGAPVSRVETGFASFLGANDFVGQLAAGQYELVSAAHDEGARAVARLEAAFAGQPPRRVGVACLGVDGSELEELLECARSRAHGRQSIAVSSTPPSDSMERLHWLVERVSAGTINVLILGETGAGKEVLAHRIHRMSPRAGKPFLRLNCAAISDTLLESELFGYERGAFTGAAQSKPGLLETAEGGTVLLDEVGELPLVTQVKLLRVIEEREVMRVGGLHARPVDLRVLAATNRNLQTEVERGTFRRDLYFRLCGVTLIVPPLRARLHELETLARRFLEEGAREAGFPRAPELSAEALEVLRRHSWPGNIRELRNVMMRAVCLCGGDRITAELLPLHDGADGFSGSAPVAPSLVPALPAPADTMPNKWRQILEALSRCGGNQTKAAALLGISRRALINRMDSYGLPRPRKI